jgi:FkbH-like protein
MSTETLVRKSPVGQLRALRRAGLAGAAAEVQSLLRGVTDTLDLEAVGALLAGAQARSELSASGAFRTQAIALLGSSTLDALPNLLTGILVQGGVLPAIRLAGFNQWRLEILSGAPNLADLAPRIVACLLDDQAVFESIVDPVDVASIEAGCAAFPAELAGWVDACQAALGGRVVLCTVPLSPLRSQRIIDYRGKARLAAAWDRMNAAILDLAAAKPRTTVLCAAAIAAGSGAIFATDRMRHVAGHAFSPDFLRAYAAELARVARADLGLARKCLALDLDNTLWGGVVGDDGVGGLRLGGAYPGSAHRELQALARDLMAQGVVLTVCSKNDDAVAREAIATHPEMVLKLDDFVAVSANWRPKPDNLRDQAAAINIGLDSVVFVDDNPVERGAVRALLPQVTTVELPVEPAGYAAHLAARGDFNLLELTGEDLERTAMYRAQTGRAALEQAAGSLEEYLVGLGSELALEPLGELNRARIVQLFAKTNQFNLTGRRYSEEEVVELQAGGGALFGARLSDRFGDSGLIGAVALVRSEGDERIWTIDNFVLSCRVFSRSVEDAIAGLVLRGARAAGVDAVAAGFVETAKNQKFAGFYPGLGFDEIGADGSSGRRFRHELRHLPELPRWIRVARGAEVFHAS